MRQSARGGLTLLVGALAAALATGLLVARAHATTPGKNGRIAFTRYRRQDNPIWSEIFVANADGSGAHRVSHSATAIEDDQAHWSPDGKWLVFARCQPAPEVCSIWLVRPDGSDQHRVGVACPAHAVPPACEDDGNPSFAPDGKHIVFQRGSGHIHQDPQFGDTIERSAIVETDLAGSHATVLVALTGYRGDVMAPKLSPDGKRLLFERFNSSRTRPTGGLALFVSDLGGRRSRRVTPWSLKAAGADWSPDGTQILFRPSLPDGELAPGSNLFTIRPDGTGLHQVTAVPADHYVLNGSYSPDGNSIVFATDFGATPNSRGSTAADVFVMPLGGKQLTPVTRTANLDGWPAWGAAAVG